MIRKRICQLSDAVTVTLVIGRVCETTPRSLRLITHHICHFITSLLNPSVAQAKANKTPIDTPTIRPAIFISLTTLIVQIVLLSLVRFVWTDRRRNANDRAKTQIFFRGKRAIATERAYGAFS